MKNIVIILALLMLNSCYTRKRAIEKFCKSDSVSVTIHDTIRTETLRVDSVFSVNLDTILLTKDRLSIRYIKVRDSIYLSGNCLGDTLYITKEVKVQTICPSISSYSFNQWLEGQPFWVGLIVMLILIFALLYTFQTLVDVFNKRQSK
jgi:hypothetical protein